MYSFIKANVLDGSDSDSPWFICNVHLQTHLMIFFSSTVSVTYTFFLCNFLYLL